MRIVMDEAGDIPAEMIQKHSIVTVPINIMFGTEQYLSGIDMDHATFYEKAKTVTAANFPKTSQPTPYQYSECYKKILASGEREILAITVSEKLSGTFASATQAAKELVGQGSFHVFDSKAGSAVQGFMAAEAARMAEAGISIERILSHLKKMRDEMAVFLTIDSLEFAVKGGRVSPLRSMMASLLKIKPILGVDDGVFVEAGKVRTRSKALAQIVELVRQHVGERATKLAVVHANAIADARHIHELVASKVKISEGFIMDLSVAVAINLGPGAVGIVVIPD